MQLCCKSDKQIWLIDRGKKKEKRTNVTQTFFFISWDLFYTNLHGNDRKSKVKYLSDRTNDIPSTSEHELRKLDIYPKSVPRRSSRVTQSDFASELTFVRPRITGMTLRPCSVISAVSKSLSSIAVGYSRLIKSGSALRGNRGSRKRIQHQTHTRARTANRIWTAEGWLCRTRGGCSIGRDALNVPKGYPPLSTIPSVSTRITGPVWIVAWRSQCGDNEGAILNR